MAFISQQDLQGIFQKADATGQKLNREEIVQELVNRGNEIEGLNAPKSKRSLLQRFSQSFGTPEERTIAKEQEVAEGRSGFSVKDLPGDVADVVGSAIPTAGMLVGGSVGGILGLGAGGIGAFPGAVAGAGVGAAVGEAGRQAGGRLLGMRGEETVGSELTEIAQEGKRGAVAQAIGGAIGKGLSKVGQIVAGPLKESAKASIGRVLAPTTKTMKQATQKITPEILQRPLSETASMTRKGMLEKASQQVEKAGDEILEYPTLAGRTKVSGLLDVLEAKKADFIVGGKAVVPEAIEKITSVQRILGQFGDVIRDKDLQSVGRILSKEVAKGKNAFLIPADEASKIEAQKLASNAIRKTLAEKYPDLAKLNKEFTFWKSFEDVLMSSSERKVGQSAGLIKNLATVGGAVSGATPVDMGMRAMAMRFIATAVQSPGWGLISAKVKDRLANSLVSGTSQELKNALEAVTKVSIQSMID